MQDPYNTQNFNRYGYVLNNPLKYTDPSGEFIVAALIGAAIGVIANGINNSINGEGFFKGAGKAAIYGAIGGAASFGIGQIASSIASSMAGSSFAGIVTGGFQAGAHSLLGGTLSVVQGGDFGAGALSGAFSSGIGSLVNGIKIGSKLLSSVAKIGASGISGGIGGLIGGGNFIDGMRQGLITGGLNHGVHGGWFGPNVAAAAMTQKLRHLFGPDAKAIFGQLSAIPGVGTKFEKGLIQYMRGKNAGMVEAFDGAALGLGLPTISGEAGATNLYFSGSVAEIKSSTFFGAYTELNVGIDVGASVGGSVSYSKVPGGNVYGFSVSIGLGASPVWFLDLNIQRGVVLPGKSNRSIPVELINSF